MDEDIKRKIQLARQRGWSEDDITRFAYADMARKQASLQQAEQQITAPVTTTPVTQPTQPKKEKGFRASDLLPIAGGVVGAVGGSLLGPVGTVVGGGAGAAGGEALRQKLEKEQTNIGKIALEGGLSAIPVGRVFGLGKAALGIGAKTVVKEGVVKAGENIIERAGKKLGLRAIKAAPTTDQANFLELIGQPLEDFQAANKLYGSTKQILTKTGSLIKTSQKAYDELVRTGEQVPVKDFVTMLKAKATEMKKDVLGKTLSPEIKATANALLAKAKFVTRAAGKKGMTTVDKIVEAKGASFRGVTPSTMRDAAALNADKLAGGIGIEYLDQFAPGSAKLGKYLQGLREFEDIVKKRAGKGEGSQLFNIHKAGYAGAAAGGLLGGGIPGAIAGAIAGEALNSPWVISQGAQALQKAGRSIVKAGPIVTPIAGQIAGQAGMRAVAAPFRTEGELPSSPAQVSFVKPAEAVSTEITGGVDQQFIPPAPAEEMKPYTKDQLYKAAAWDLQNNGGKGIGEIKQLYDLYYGGQATKPKPAIIKNMENLATAGLKGLADAQAMFEDDPNVVLKGLVTGGLASRKFEAAMNRAIEGILRARSGAAVPETEVRKYRLIYGPKVGDSEATALYKLEALRQDLQGMLTGNENVVDYNQLPASPPQVTFPQ